MKKILPIIMLMIMLNITACAQEKAIEQENGLNWFLKLEKAQEAAAETGNPIFVHFTGSDWCGWCKKLKAEVYDKQPFIEYANDNLVLLKLDFPKTIKQSEETKMYNKKLAQKYQIRGFPTVVLLNENAEEITRTGYQAGGPEAYVKHIEELLKE